MKKSELVYLALMQHALSKKKEKLTQLSLHRELGLSLSVINNAIKPLREMGAVQVRIRSLQVLDTKKLLLFWASVRRLKRDITYQTRANIPVSQIEKSMPSGVIFTAYSGYKFQFPDVPADYSEIYVYADERALEEIQTRFPKANGPANIFVLKSDSALAQFCKNSSAPPAILYADIWNLPQWHAREFLASLEGFFKW